MSNDLVAPPDNNDEAIRRRFDSFIRDLAKNAQTAVDTVAREISNDPLSMSKEFVFSRPTLTSLRYVTLKVRELEQIVEKSLKNTLSVDKAKAELFQFVSENYQDTVEQNEFIEQINKMDLSTLILVSDRLREKTLDHELAVKEIFERMSAPKNPVGHD